MKHQKAGRKFSRVKNQRRALIKSLLNNFIIQEKITTTEAKAKEVKSIVDKVISKVKKINEKNKVAILRDLRKSLPEKAIKKLSGEFSKKFEGRNSGFARVAKLGRRKGDSARMAVIEFV